MIFHYMCLYAQQLKDHYYDAWEKVEAWKKQVDALKHKDHHDHHKDHHDHHKKHDHDHHKKDDKDQQAQRPIGYEPADAKSQS